MNELRARAERALAAVGLARARRSSPEPALRRAAAARRDRARSVNDPEVLLADEPTGNLDSRTSVEIMGIFQKLNEQGITIVMVTHELDIAAYCRSATS